MDSARICCHVATRKLSLTDAGQSLYDRCASAD
jgi:hypothetical protein